MSPNYARVGLWKRLTDEEFEAFEAFALDPNNWHLGQRINPVWHPVTRAACASIEFYSAQADAQTIGNPLHEKIAEA